MNADNLRISKLREYLFGIIDTLTNDSNYSINANWLSNDINNYSLDKIPVVSTVETWITGLEIHRDVYSFRSRFNYSSNEKDNRENIGFFEKFEELISLNNEKGILPDIEGIENIRCLNCGTLNNAETDSAEFDIQIEINYKCFREEE
jgi:hypothetical protein